MQHYIIAGLLVASELALPGVSEGPAGAPDVELRRELVPDRLAAPTVTGPIWELDAANFLLRLPGVGRLLAQDGRRLVIEADPGIDPQELLVFALGTGVGALLYQRGLTVLHASAVAEGPSAVAFCGPSGVGKSTLAAALCNAGCQFVGDDVLAVRLDADKQPIVSPDARQLKLFDTGLSALGLAQHRQSAVRANVEKYYVKPPGQVATGPLPLRALYVLTRDERLEDPQFEPLQGLQAARILQLNGYRPRLAAAMARNGNPVAVTAAILSRVPVYRLSRPTRLKQLPSLVDALQQHWRSLGTGKGDAVPD